LLGIGKSHEAAAHYIQALRINPSLIEAYNNLGAILVNDGKFDQAIALFQKALALNPNFLEAKKNLEDTIWEKKNQEIRK
jgi:tetratricopeptide (TPR) repeat protein